MFTLRPVHRRSEPVRPQTPGIAYGALLFCAALAAPAFSQSQTVPSVDESIVVEDSAPTEAEEAERTSSSVTVIAVDPRTDSLTPVSEILSRTVGVEVRRYGGLGSFSTLSIRGSSPTQVTVYLDGSPLTGADTGLVNIDDVSAGSIERIEVYRGSAPGRFASAGIGGVVNLVTRRARSGPEWLLAAEGGQYGTAGGRLTGALRKDAMATHLTIHALRSDGNFRFLDDNGTPLNPDDDVRVERRNNRFEQVDGTLRAELQASGRLHLELVADAFAKAEGVPGLGANQAERTRFASRRLTLSLAGRLDGFLAPAGSLEATLYGALRREHYQDPLGEVGVGVQDEIDRFGDAGARLQGSWPLAGGAHRLSALLELERETHRLEDLERGLGRDSGRWSLSLVLEDPVLLGQGALELTPLLRVQRLHSDLALPGTPADPLDPLPAPDQWSVSPSLGLRHALGGGQLKANAGRSYRIPSFSELFGDRGSVIGNAALRPEAGWSFDLGWLRARPLLGGRLLRLEATLFASFVDDLVVYVQNSQKTFQPFNIGRARTLGLEASAAGRIGPADLSLAYTLQDARDTSGVSFLDGNELPGRSRHHASAELRWPIGSLRLGTTLELLSANFLDRANLHPVGARLYQGASVTAGGRGSWPEVSLELKNLWDQQTADVGGFPLPGRSVFLGLRWQSSRPAESERRDRP
jgi:iron complex outermembrane recepter protein